MSETMPRPDILNRCDWCNWPLEESRESGCHESDCSFRPLPTPPPDFELRRYIRQLERENAALREELTEARNSALREGIRSGELFNLVDRAAKMLWLACPETREPVYADSHNPIVAWVADAQRALLEKP